MNGIHEVSGSIPLGSTKLSVCILCRNLAKRLFETLLDTPDGDHMVTKDAPLGSGEAGRGCREAGPLTKFHSQKFRHALAGLLLFCVSWHGRP